MTAQIDEGRATAHPELEDFLEERGIRFEVIDGTIVVNAPPTWDHQESGGEIFVALRVAAPEALTVMYPGLPVYYSDDNYLEPDVIVCRRSDKQREGLRATPLLVVEVLSPGTRRFDLRLKRDIYAEIGVASYWIVDPDKQTFTVLELEGEEYAQSASLEGRGPFTLTTPYPVTISPFG